MVIEFKTIAFKTKTYTYTSQRYFIVLFPEVRVVPAAVGLGAGVVADFADLTVRRRSLQTHVAV